MGKKIFFSFSFSIHCFRDTILRYHKVTLIFFFWFFNGYVHWIKSKQSLLTFRSMTTIHWVISFYYSLFCLINLKKILISFYPPKLSKENSTKQTFNRLKRTVIQKFKPYWIDFFNSAIATTRKLYLSKIPIFVKKTMTIRISSTNLIKDECWLKLLEHLCNV